MFLNLCVKAEMVVRDFIEQRDGVTAIEYALVGVAIAGIVTAVFGTNGDLEKALDEGMKTIKDKMK
ncbi:Flp family type IVb pilin [Vibrio sp. SM6]|uniref:Flp family type IVb pilin n=1 Tax=Vibrio agarilyticus TaxID=2726741 RepID=A0A7X8TQM9_9VIBR|nr:Flp family type IVb pilin [Vibrio agarilyticus]NLS13085.1 Flp family type IVb pilin [Vibrio agarilyticus]